MNTQDALYKTIEANYHRVRDGIAAACAKAGRNVDEITLVAVTKFMPEETIIPALELGIRHVGENRAQEFREKSELFKNYGCFTHFIGHLQTNKVKYVIGNADLVQSVDSVELAKALQQGANRRATVQDILIEVNIGEEPQKAGIPADGLAEMFDVVGQMPNLRLKGLMCIPPALQSWQTRPYFAKMRALFEKYRHVNGMRLGHLSMGMTGDYGVAIEEGATIVRVGTGLFGVRHV
ncbi:MAG: YggS family pyridoxal phosphate-dependent enzyme [Clostridiales bacterium]|jgi:pyridoxal phosphate enzyme (YggS family)|nr:YggS family pyridoxal phosphate-dependent enzyme [Clostridiales bacterium]